MPASINPYAPPPGTSPNVYAPPIEILPYSSPIRIDTGRPKPGSPDYHRPVPKKGPYTLKDYGVFSNIDDELGMLENEFTRLSEEKSKLSSASSFDRGLANQLKNEFGIDYNTQIGSPSIIGTSGAPRIPGISGASSDNFGTGGRGEAETDVLLSQALDEQLKAIKPRMEALKEKKIFSETEGLLGKARTKEQALREQLLEGQTKLVSSLEQRLNSSLEEAGIKAGEARALTGSALAQRGLSRSTMGSQALGEITSTEQEQKGQFRTEAAKVKGQISTGIEGTLKGIEDKRKRLEIDRSLTNLKTFQDIGFQIDHQAIADKFKQAILNAELDANDRIFTEKLVGGIAGGILGFATKIFGGG